MLKLRTLLLYNNLYIFLAITLTIVALVFSCLNINRSIYQGEEKIIIGYIDNLKIDGNKITIDLITKEKIIVIYYANSKKELDYIKNNYHLGDYLKISGELKLPANNTVNNLFNYKKYLYHHRIYYILKATQITKYKNNNNLLFTIKQFIITRINNLNYSGDSVKAFALGNSSSLDDNIMVSYQNNGISHLLALSGANVAFLAVIMLFILQKLQITETKRYIIVIILLFIYTFLANFTASIVRATLFFCLISINKIYYFHIKPINILLLTYSILIFINYYYLYDLGFQFSFIISFYLLLLQTYITSGNSFIILLKVSFISFIAALPITIYNFFQINLLSIIYNLFFVPLVSFIIYPLSLLVIAIPLLDYPLSFFISIMEIVSLNIDKITVSKLILAKPNLMIIFLYYLIITYSLLLLPQKKYYPFIGIIIILVAHTNCHYFMKYPRLTMIDVNQGDSFLLQLPHNQGNILIDTGGKLLYEQKKYQLKNKNYNVALDTIIPYLKSLGINHLDYLILTHGDYDHMGDALSLVSAFKVNNIIINDYDLTNIEKPLSKKENVIIGHSDDVISLNNLRLYVLNPNQDYGENDNSLVIYTKIYNYSLLFMGDASTKIENELINKYNLNNIDILKIGHHGSATSTSEAFLNATSPQYALISVGAKNNFGHPHQTVLNKLNTRDITTYITSQDGSVTIVFKPQKLIFSTCH